MQRPSHVGEHVPINMSRLYLRGDISLKIRDQTGRVRVPAVAAVAQVLEQLLQQKQITERKRLILAPWRHVAREALEGDKDLPRGSFKVPIEIRRERRRPALGDCSRNASRMLMRRRGLWLGSAHHAVSSNHAMLPPGPVVRLIKISEIHRRLRRLGTHLENACSAGGMSCWAAFDRHLLTSRWSVRSCPLPKRSGACSSRRMRMSNADKCGAVP